MDFNEKQLSFIKLKVQFIFRYDEVTLFKILLRKLSITDE